MAAVQKAKKASGSRSSNSHAESEEEDATEEPKDNQTEKVNEDEDPLLWKPFPPAWMHPNWWERLCEYWAKEEVLQMSLKYRKNRFVGGRAHHTSGSRSFAMQRQLMVRHKDKFHWFSHFNFHLKKLRIITHYPGSD